MEEVRTNEEKGDIFLGCCSGYRFLWRFEVRIIVSDISEGNDEILGKEK